MLGRPGYIQKYCKPLSKILHARLPQLNSRIPLFICKRLPLHQVLVSSLKRSTYVAPGTFCDISIPMGYCRYLLLPSCGCCLVWVGTFIVLRIGFDPKGLVLK